MPKIFISYRRADSQHVTDRISDHMHQHFGQDNVFQDVDNIPFGVDFREYLRQEVEKCDAVLVIIGPDWAQNLTTANSMGIIGGLVLGKPLGITLLSFIAVSIGVCRLPLDLNWKHVFGAGLLGGIGFTMSIFITNLAFVENAEAINASKMAILLASLTAGTTGFVWLKLLGQPEKMDKDMDTMDFEATEA